MAQFSSANNHKFFGVCCACRQSKLHIGKPAPKTVFLRRRSLLEATLRNSLEPFVLRVCLCSEKSTSKPITSE